MNILPFPPSSDPFRIDDGIALLGAMVRAYDNPESHDEDKAIDALREGRPAFWTTATYHNQAARLTVEWANGKTLGEALARFADDRSIVEARHTMRLLDTLIPLHGAAIRALLEARGAAALKLVTDAARAHAKERPQAAE